MELCGNGQAGGEKYDREKTQTNTQVSRKQRNCHVGSQDRPSKYGQRVSADESQPGVRARANSIPSKSLARPVKDDAEGGEVEQSQWAELVGAEGGGDLVHEMAQGAAERILQT